jgi:sec-independent protein translocase protein TatC
MPRYPNEDDLFKDSTMTFGQHLEELRACLFKAILGLTVGMLVGLAVGKWVVEFIQTPLQSALKEYYNEKAFQAIDGVAKELKERGYSQEHIESFVASIKERVKRDKVTFEVYYFDREHLLEQLKDDPSLSKATLSPTEPSAGDSAAAVAGQKLMPMPLYRPSSEDPRLQVKSLNAQEPFMIYLKASLLVGVVFASPWIFYQIWSFVGAGLYPHEKKYVHMFLPFSVGLFLAGASMAFFFVFEPVLRFLLSFNTMLGIAPEMRINEWMGFVLLLPLGFGVSFQLPLVMLFMERIGIFTVNAYMKSWRVAILAIFILAMTLTPSGDPYSMCLMAFPLCFLYMGGIALCRFLPRQRSAFNDA